MENVLEVRPDLLVHPLAPMAVPWIKTSTDNQHHCADREHARGNTGKGVAVAIVDCSQNDQLNGPGKPHRTYYIDGDKTNTSGPGIGGSRLLANKAFGSYPANWLDPHGTGVFSIAAGGSWGTSLADHGHAYGAHAVGYGLADRSDCATTLAIEAAAWQAVAKDAAAYKIVAANMSYSSNPDPTDISQQAIDACALHANVLPVTAAGNLNHTTRFSSSTANGLAVAACFVALTTHWMVDLAKELPLFGVGGPRDC